MSFATLAANQMVSEADALTSGFASIGAKIPSTQCYAKAAALTAYNLSATAMASYTDTQLVPKSVWQVNPGTLSLAYSGTNSIRGIVTGDFNTARNTGDITILTNFTVACFFNAGNYTVQRAYCGFDTTLAKGIVGANLQINVATNTLATSTSFVFVRTITNFAANHPWVVGDFAQSVGAVAQTNTVSITAGFTGVVNFPLNATGIAYVNGSNACTFVLVQFANDHSNVAPGVTAAQAITGANSNMKLIYS